jgi:hypothetical protein
MTGTVGTTIVIKGKKIRVEECYDEQIDGSFELALRKVSERSIAMRKSAALEATSKRSGYRKPKGSKKN